jgi:hypothetical protein
LAELTRSQTVTVTGSPTGGTFTLSFGGSTSAAIAFNASVAVVEDVLEAWSRSVTAMFASVDRPVARGRPLPECSRSRKQALFTKNAAGLTGGTSPNVTIVHTDNGSDLSGNEPAVSAGWDPRILVGSPDFPGTIVVKVASADGGTLDKVKEYTGTGSIFGVIDGVEEFIVASPAGDRDVAVHQYNCVFDASKIKNYSTYKTAFDAWAAANICKVVNG